MPHHSKQNEPDRPRIVYAYRPGALYLNITNRCTNACVFCSLRLNQGRLGPFNLDLTETARIPVPVHPGSLQRCSGLIDRAWLEQDPDPCAASSDPRILEAMEAEPDASTILNELDQHIHASSHALEEVVFCGAGEPLIRLDTVLEVAQSLKKRRISVRVNTNGHANLIHGPDTAKALGGCVDAISISLNAQDRENYRLLSRPTAGDEAYESLLDFAAQCVAAIPEVTLSVVLLAPDTLKKLGARLDVQACKTLADRMGADFRQR